MDFKMFLANTMTFNDDTATSPWNASCIRQDTVPEDGEDRRPDFDDACTTSSSSEGSTKAKVDASSEVSSHKSRSLAPNLTRRSHRKSRAGCFSCKGRKIKCGEEKPICKNCQLKELGCQFPQHDSGYASRAVAARRPPSPQQSPIPPHPLSNFSLTDMRLFHHFLTVAYPHLPAGNESVWIREVPKFAFSENHEYLMHAILALGASHLDRMRSQKEYQTQAIVHRGHAIAGLNKAISKKHIADGEADAMLAACYALTFQASYMDDGLADFITMVRGCALVTSKIMDEQAQTVFNLQSDLDFKSLEPGWNQLKMVDQEFINAGVGALSRFLPLLVSKTDIDFYHALLGVLQALRNRSGFVNFMGVYSVWHQLCGDSFNTFLDPNNATAQVLLGYFIAIQMMMVPITQPLYHFPRRQLGTRIEILLGIVQWSVKIFQNTPSHFQEHLAWPKSVIATVQEEIANPDAELRILRIPDKAEIIRPHLGKWGLPE